MKIIEERNNHKIFPMKIECKKRSEFGISLTDSSEHCGSILEVEESDIFKFTRYHPQLSVPVTLYGVICPHCKKTVIINEDRIPDKIKRRAKIYEE